MRRSLVVVVVSLLLVLPAAANAATPTDDIYDPTDKQQQESSGLPFTGLDVGIVVLAGAFVLGTGLAVRRAVTRSE